MDVRLIAFDLDGTTLVRHQFISEANQRALREAARRGMVLVPASGRMKDFLPQEITSLPGVRYAITANGAGVYDLETGQAVWQCLIPNEKARQVQALLSEYDIFVEYYDGGRAITRRGDPERAVAHFGIPESKLHFLTKDYRLEEELGEALGATGLQPEKINLPYIPSEAMRQELWQRLEGLGGLAVTSSIPDNLEINAAGADKGAALQALAGRLGIPQAGVMALGDNGNDVTMLQYAGVSVCMGDGSEEAKAAAKYLTGPHTEDGLAQAIERFAFA